MNNIKYSSTKTVWTVSKNVIQHEASWKIKLQAKSLVYNINFWGWEDASFSRTHWQILESSFHSTFLLKNLKMHIWVSACRSISHF